MNEVHYLFLVCFIEFCKKKKKKKKKEKKKKEKEEKRKKKWKEDDTFLKMILNVLI